MSYWHNPHFISALHFATEGLPSICCAFVEVTPDTWAFQSVKYYQDTVPYVFGYILPFFILNDGFALYYEDYSSSLSCLILEIVKNYFSV